VTKLQEFKDSPADFDPTPVEYSSLLKYDLSKYEPNPNDTPEK